MNRLAIFLLVVSLAPLLRAEDPDLLVREDMVKISHQLGVTCNHCHDVKNFKSDHLPAFQTAKQHMKVVELLNTKGFTGSKAPRADCYLCHRGKSTPDYKEIAEIHGHDAKKESHEDPSKSGSPEKSKDSLNYIDKKPAESPRPADKK